MGKIRERLKLVAEAANTERNMEYQLDHTGEAIEAEFQELEEKIEKQDKKIEDIEAGIHNLFEMLKRRTKRIEALEKIHPFSLQDHRHTEKINIDKFLIPCDRHGKPLERGNVVSYYFDQEPAGKILGQFCRAKGNDIWAYWQNMERNDLQKTLDFMPKDKVTFEFRPKPEKS